MEIYITHCSRKKSSRFRRNHQRAFPQELYTSSRIKGFMNKCKEKNVKWAIFSDKYGVWFSDKKHKWYDKNPDKVTIKEFKSLVKDFDKKLCNYRRIFFYRHPTRFHTLYELILERTKLKNKVKQFTKKDAIR